MKKRTYQILHDTLVKKIDNRKVLQISLLHQFSGKPSGVRDKKVEI